MPIAPSQMTNLSPKKALQQYTRDMIKKAKKIKKAESCFQRKPQVGVNYRTPNPEELKICPF